MTQSTSVVCDTIPAPRLVDLDQDLQGTTMAFGSDLVFHDTDFDISDNSILAHEKRMVVQQPKSRKLCARHQRMADEGTNIKLQQVSNPNSKISKGRVR